MNLKSLFIFVILLSLLASCTPESSIPNEGSELTIINLQVTPALIHWLSQAATCANSIPDFGVYTRVFQPESLDLNDADLILRMGEPQEKDPHIAVMGIEELVIVVGNQVPLSSISLSSLRAIFNGRLKNWSEVPEIIDANIEIKQPIQPWSYPEGHELNIWFTDSILLIDDIAPNVKISSTVETLQNEFQKNPYGISYLLKSQMREGFQKLSITGINPPLIQYYVLVITNEEPSDRVKQLLLCLQNPN